MTAQVPDAAEMSVARRLHCALIVTRTHISCTTPDFLHDVPHCSVQHFINKKASIFKQMKSGACAPLFISRIVFSPNRSFQVGAG
jgi:hypothetical protein